jgi:hypothetical protein
MTVTRTERTLTAVRTQSSDGNLCRYEGNFVDARTVKGTATCPGSNQTNVTTFEFTLTLDDR